jgi:hypothetical protein
MKKLIKTILKQLGISENSPVLKPFRIVSASIRELKILEKSADMIGFFASQMIQEPELKSYWKMIQPYSNGHKLVRVGGKGDGGYLLPDDFDEIKYCFSPGAGAIWTFEEMLGSKFGIESLVCDGTIDRYPSFKSLKSFIPMNVGITESENVISFETWVGAVGADPGDLLLQMDIEGGEYPILSSIEADFLKKFRIVVLELHDLHLLALRSSFSFQYSQLMSKLLKNFDVVHLHPNNCGGSYVAHGILLPKVAEITLHRKDRSQELVKVTIPHQLDSPNNADIGEFPDFSFVEWLSE